MRLPPTLAQSASEISAGHRPGRVLEPARPGLAGQLEDAQVDQAPVGLEQPGPEHGRGDDRDSDGRKKRVRKMVVPLTLRFSSSATSSEPTSPSGTLSAA